MDIEQFKFNVPNLPLFDSGSEAFLGDYIDIVPSPAFVPSGNSWAYNFMPSVNPLFHAVWTDNRDVVPPPAGGSWENYTAPVVAGAISVENGNPLPACVPGEEGMRNQNIYTSQITGGLVAERRAMRNRWAQRRSTARPCRFSARFPLEAQNTTARAAQCTIHDCEPADGWHRVIFAVFDVDDVGRHHSAVLVGVAERVCRLRRTLRPDHGKCRSDIGDRRIVVSNGLSSTAILNPDITNPSITNPDITNPGITNPKYHERRKSRIRTSRIRGITNPNITNPNITNPNITNTSYLNPNITNPNITNSNVTNVSATNPTLRIQISRTRISRILLQTRISRIRASPTRTLRTARFKT